MRWIVGIALLLVAGCSPANAALVRDARETGDWTEFENRQQDELEKESAIQQVCPTGRDLYCETVLGSTYCGCVIRTPHRPQRRKPHRPRF